MQNVIFNLAGILGVRQYAGSMNKTTDQDLSFRGGRSEMANLMSHMDWANHPLGVSESWPIELRTSLSLMMNSQFPMFLTFGPERHFFYNDAYIPILGNKKHPRALGDRFENIWSDIWSDLSPIVKRVDSGESSYFENMPLYMNRNGKFEQTYFTFSYSPIQDAQSQVVGLFCACVETTVTVVAQRSLIESAQQTQQAYQEAAVSLDNLKSFFMQAPLSMVILEGTEHRFTLANPPYERFAGQKVIGKTVHDVFPADQLAKFIPLLDSVKETGNPVIGREMPIHFPNETGEIEEHWIDIGYHPFRAADGNIRGVLAVVQEVTEHIQARKKIEAAREEAEKAKLEAERANELKSAFLANMSHEIRTPLGAMMGFADLLHDPGLTASERASFTNILIRNGESLSVIINDILDLSKVEAGQLTLEYTDTYPDKIGADVISLLRVKANEKDLVLEYSHDESSPASIVSDPIRVRQILLNLVSNAIKFTRFGSVTVRSYSCKTEDGRDALCFEVKDTGMGIAEDQQENIFEMFVQADDSMTRRFGGTGLGLALSRSLARTLGGDVTITASQLGVGTTFLTKIEDQPLRRVSEVAEKTRSAPSQTQLGETPLAGVNVLVVDDSPDNQQLIWRYLTKKGAVVESAENGLLGYRTALTGNFDLVLMDIQMPVMDGYMATQKLREAGFEKPIIALTAHAMSEVRRRALNVGYTEHLTKPINPGELIETIARLTVKH